MGQVLDFSPPTHHKQYSQSNSGPPDICDLMYVRQQPREMVHHFWSRLLLVRNKIKDCYDDDAVSVFCRNCTNKGILNALNRRRIQHFTNLTHIVQKYRAMESAWKAQTVRWEPLPLSNPPYGRNGCTLTKHPTTGPLTRKTNPSQDIEQSLTNC